MCDCENMNQPIQKIKRPPLPVFRYLENDEKPASGDMVFLPHSRNWVEIFHPEHSMKTDIYCTKRPLPKRKK